MFISVSGIYSNLLKIEEWNVGIVQQPIANFLTADIRSETSWLPPARGGKYLADPFGLIRDGRMFILCEEFDYAHSMGRIVLYEENQDHTAWSNQVSIELPTHMSYPYLLEYDGEVYCIPETAQAREISLYKAQDFPRQWRKMATLIGDFPGLDSSVFKFDRRWWLTCSNLEDGPWEKLFIWYADHLTGPWQPHSANPVKVNAYSSRPAGTPFMHEGNLYRPAQNCSQAYGKSIRINRIKNLTTTEFQEEEVASIEPLKPYPHGVHTVSSVGGMSLLDGRRLRFIRSRSELNHNLASQRRNLQRRVSGQRGTSIGA